MANFELTQWTVVQRAGAASAEGHAALEALCRAYRPPVLAYIRHHGHADAEDLAQAFFMHLLDGARYTLADPSRGKFRAFLLTALKRFLIDQADSARAQKRGGAIEIRSFDTTGTQTSPLQFAAAETPENAFQRDFMLVVLHNAMHRLRAETEQAGKVQLFDELREFLTERPAEADYQRVAAVLGLRPNTLAVAVHRLRQRLRELLRDELKQTTPQEEFEREWKTLQSDVLEKRM